MSEKTKKGSGERTTNTLTAAQSYRLTSWLDAKREFLVKEKKSRQDAANMASADLGFPITENNVTHSCRTIELKLFRSLRGATRTKNSARLTKVEQDVQTVVQLMKDLETAENKNLTTFAAALANLSSRLRTVENKLNIQPPSHLQTAIPVKNS